MFNVETVEPVALLTKFCPLLAASVTVFVPGPEESCRRNTKKLPSLPVVASGNVIVMFPAAASIKNVVYPKYASPLESRSLVTTVYGKLDISFLFLI
jgi:hypothetical protein